MQSRSKEVRNYNPFDKYYVDNSYKYYDTPDGQDFLKKLWYTTKLGMKSGYMAGGFYALAKQDRSLSRLWLLPDFFRVFTPFVIASTTYTVTTYGLTELRKVDDEHNAQIGGAAAGLIFGTWFRAPTAAIVLAILGATFCGWKKIGIMEGVTFPHTDYHREAGSAWVLRKLDFTLTKNYTADDLEIPV